MLKHCNTNPSRIFIHFTHWIYFRMHLRKHLDIQSQIKTFYSKCIFKWICTAIALTIYEMKIFFCNGHRIIMIKQPVERVLFERSSNWIWTSIFMLTTVHSIATAKLNQDSFDFVGDKYWFIMLKCENEGRNLIIATMEFLKKMKIQRNLSHHWLYIQDTFFS